MIFVNEGPARFWASESLSVVHTTSMFWLDNLSIFQVRVSPLVEEFRVVQKFS